MLSNLYDQLKTSYQSLFDSCRVNVDIQNQASAIITKITANKQRYSNIESVLSVPWYVIAVIHCMKASLNFNCHLHNSYPLTARTTQVPAGHSVNGNPPFTWEQSAIDALQLEGFNHWIDWSIAGIGNKLKRYNGTGYRAHGINSPYLWGSSNIYTVGKYVLDGSFSPTAISKQIGAMVLLKLMQNQKLIQLG